MSANVAIRWLIRQDLPEVLAIERNVYVEPWDEDEFLCCMGQRNCIGLVAEQSHRIIGYMLYELHRCGLKIIRLTVADHAQGQGVGEKFIEKLKGKIRIHGRRSELFLMLHEDALEGQLFFQAQGFRATEVLRGHYDDDTDAYLMIWHDEPEPGAPSFEGTNRVAMFL